MVTNAALQLILSVIFGVSGIYFVVRLFIGVGSVDRIINLAHVLMSATMFAMVWPWGAHVPLAPQFIVFSVAAVWFVYLAVFRPNVPFGAISAHHRRPLLLGYHAIMMASMVWMAAQMSLTPMSKSMASMSMGTPSHAMTAPSWALAISFVFAAFFALATVVFIVEAIREKRPVEGPHSELVLPDDLGRIVMALGMSIAFVVMR